MKTYQHTGLIDLTLLISNGVRDSGTISIIVSNGNPLKTCSVHPLYKLYDRSQTCKVLLFEIVRVNSLIGRYIYNV